MKSKSKIPTVKIESVDLSENCYCNNGESWDIPTILQFVKEQELKPFDAPLACFDLSKLYWPVNSTILFVHHMKRCNECDLKYPIILSDCGELIDGAHRLCKALLLGHKTIKCIRLPYMPNSSGKLSEKK